MAKDYDGKKPTRFDKSSMDTKYPYNKATITEAGHEIHYDDTPGKERIRIAHKSGTHFEIHPDGKLSMYNVGHKQEYNKGGVSVTTDENGDIKISGHMRENISGGKHSTIKGDGDAVGGGHSTIIVVGNAKIAVAGDCYSGVKGDMNMNIGGNMNMKVAGSTTMETGGDHIIKASSIKLN